MIEQVKICSLAQFGLLYRQSFGSPSIERVAGRCEHAFVNIVCRVESEEDVREITIQLANFGLIGLRSRRPRRQQAAQRPYLAAVEAGNQRHLGLLAAIKSLGDLMRDQYAIYGAPGQKPGPGRAIDEFARLHVAHGREIGCAELTL